MSAVRAPGTERAPRAAAPDSAAAALVQGGLAGLGFAVVALLALAPPLTFALVTMLPTVLFQAMLGPHLVRSADRSTLAVAMLLLPTYLLPIAGWTLLWSGSEYGPAWPGVLGFLLAVSAPALLLQIDLLARWYARRCR